MNTSEVLELVRAGFTKSEIMGFMNSPEPAQVTQTAEPDNGQLTPEQTPVQIPESVQMPEPATVDPMKELTQRITELTQAVQASNRTYAEMGGEIIDPHTEAINTFRSVGGIPTENK